jgi:hypothetical protein
MPSLYGMLTMSKTTLCFLSSQSKFRSSPCAKLSAVRGGAATGAVAAGMTMPAGKSAKASAETAPPAEIQALPLG